MFNNLKRLYRLNKTVILSVLGLYVFYRIWPVLSGLWGFAFPSSDGGSGAAGGGLLDTILTAKNKIQTSAEDAENKRLASRTSPGQSVAFLSELRRVGYALGVAMKETGPMADFFKPAKEDVYRLLKPYARVLWGPTGKVGLWNGKPKLRNKEQNMTALAPFYALATGGRVLRVDCDALFAGGTFGDSDTDKMYKNFVRV